MRRQKYKILIIRLGAIGDVIHSTIIPKSIKAKHPYRKIHYLTDKTIAPLIEHDVNIDKVFSYDKAGGVVEFIKLLFKLRRENYDTVINLTNSLRNYIIVGALEPVKLFKRNKTREHAVDSFYNTARDIFPDIEKPDALKIYIPNEIKGEAEKNLSRFKRPYFVLSPGGQNDVNREGRIWNIKYYKELAKRLMAKYGGTTFVIGSKTERKTHEEMLEVVGVFVKSGELTLLESAALISYTDLYISGDSGPLHMAAALDVPVLGIYGATSAKIHSPYCSKGYWIEAGMECQDCNKKCTEDRTGIYKPCMEAVTPEAVMEFIEKNIEIKHVSAIKTVSRVAQNIGRFLNEGG